MGLPYVSCVAAVTGGGGNADSAARTSLCHGMEGAFLTLDEISVGRIMAHGLRTINYVSQIHEYKFDGHGASWFSETMS